MYVVDVSLSQYAIVIRSNDIFLSVLFPLWNEFFHTFIGRNKQLAWWYFCQNMEAASKKRMGKNQNSVFAPRTDKNKNKEKKFSNHTAFRFVEHMVPEALQELPICFDFRAERQNATWSPQEELHCSLVNCLR